MTDPQNYCAIFQQPHRQYFSHPEMSANAYALFIMFQFRSADQNVRIDVSYETILIQEVLLRVIK